MQGGKVVASYPASLGRRPVGAKASEGDMRTPEGVYRISQHKVDSTCYRALRISYPSPEQQAAGKAAGRAPGGNIMIHGLKNGWGWLGMAGAVPSLVGLDCGVCGGDQCGNGLALGCGG